MKNYTFNIITIIIATLTINSNMSAQKLNNEIDSVSYSLGVNIGENIKTQFPNIDIKNFEAAIKDVLDDSKEPTITGADAQKKNSRIFFKTTS
jgi:hypothetical protein